MAKTKQSSFLTGQQLFSPLGSSISLVQYPNHGEYVSLLSPSYDLSLRNIDNSFYYSYVVLSDRSDFNLSYSNSVFSVYVSPSRNFVFYHKLDIKA